MGDSLKVLDGDRGINYPHESDFFQSGDTLFLNTGNVTKNGFNFNTVKYITKEKDELLRAGRLEENDFVLTSRGTLGNIGFYDHKIYKDYPKVRINSAMLILRNVDKQLSYSYLHSVLKGKLISDFMKKNQVGSAQPHITKTEFLKLNLSIPENIKEQNKIGSFFNNFDKNITLHQRKLEQLEKLKQALLQQMFPQKDENVPRLRFANFAGDWEQRKLEDVVKINPGSILPDHFHYVDLESVKGTELISSRIEYNDTAPSRAKRLARPGDIFFQLVRPYQKNNYLFNLTEKNYVFSTGYAQLRPLINSEYLINYLTTDNFTSKVLNRSTGTSYPAINSSDLVKIKVLIPNDELESLKIGEVLELMNKVITLHHHKFNQLKLLKKELLQQMFI